MLKLEILGLNATVFRFFFDISRKPFFGIYRKNTKNSEKNLNKKFSNPDFGYK